MRNRTYDEDFNLDCVKYCAEHLELSQAEAAKKSQCTGKNIKQMVCFALGYDSRSSITSL